MTKIKIIAALMLLVSFSGSSQSLYQPRDLKEAYKNDTRNMNGKPGLNYWQNRGVYNIDIRVTPPQRTVFGSETITYTNNSPDTLRRLNFKLFLNNHKPGAPRLRKASKDFLTSGMHIDSFKENGEASTWEDLDDGTNKFIPLKEPLFPGKSVNLSIEWHYDVSVESGREGAIDSTTFFLAYFFPRVAVYDDYSGWDTMTFTGSQEFYNDFNDYTFSVTVPKNYIVWATGDLLNPEEVLQSKYADRLAKSMTSDQVIRIATPDDLKKQEITKQSTSNTWKWKADSITDIAIALSNHYNWDGGSVVVDKKTGRRASVQAAYNDDAQDFHQMVDFGKHSLQWFSNNYPGVPYPYQKSTIVRGFADMEYPMMVNDNSTPDPDFSRFVAEHEIAHTYFPFYMGINETRYGFMDEGWATALEYLIGINDLGEEAATRNFQMFRVNRWANDANAEEDIPIITPSNILTGVALGNNEYGKAAIGYLAMKDLLGDELFLTALQGYMDRWNGKHPTPWDFFYSFNDISKQNLNWFWDSWFFSNNYIDLAISDVQTKKKNTSITLQNIGGMPAPVDVIIITSSGKSKTYHYTPEIWKNNLKKASITIEGEKDVTSVKLEGGIYMDADTSNNQWTKE
ncbi:M1 family metallopeptidase [Fulvivirga sediminis]|uniref:M1 family metallopeptidase n=1 Tax=Fulvivirga sediminis TaxID=2803949 RepID=A0A937F8M6_9BACT|nr:M1 family metallopeptidase [Fulvivirga sediminis]MBL3656295.1 M1 family metallopeptidase [Fulvivirga sediminis]